MCTSIDDFERLCPASNEAERKKIFMYGSYGFSNVKKGKSGTGKQYREIIYEEEIKGKCWSPYSISSDEGAATFTGFLWGADLSFDKWTKKWSFSIQHTTAVLKSHPALIFEDEADDDEELEDLQKPSERVIAPEGEDALEDLPECNSEDR
jgi:hypothetical protein